MRDDNQSVQLNDSPTSAECVHADIFFDDPRNVDVWDWFVSRDPYVIELTCHECWAQAPVRVDDDRYFHGVFQHKPSCSAMHLPLCPDCAQPYRPVGEGRRRTKCA